MTQKKLEIGQNIHSTDDMVYDIVDVKPNGDIVIRAWSEEKVRSYRYKLLGLDEPFTEKQGATNSELCFANNIIQPNPKQQFKPDYRIVARAANWVSDILSTPKQKGKWEYDNDNK